MTITYVMVTVKKITKISITSAAMILTWLSSGLFIPTNPGAVQEDADKHGWDGEVIHKATDLEHEMKLVRGSNKLKQRVFIIFINSFL